MMTFQAGRGVHASAAPSCVVGVDCCTFDRVLLFLEAHAMGRPFDVLPEHLEGMAQVNRIWLSRSIEAGSPHSSYTLYVLHDYSHSCRSSLVLFSRLWSPFPLVQAAEALNLAPLRDLIATKRGAFESRVRQEPIALSEVKRRNASGRAARAKRAAAQFRNDDDEGGSGSGSGVDALEVKEGDEEDSKAGMSGSDEGSEETLLLLDGMVLDVSRWLEEHPGGSSIIPTQALDRDCTVFFEIYHVRRNPEVIIPRQNLRIRKKE